MGDGSYRLSAAVCAMPASDADKLIAAGSGDCALLYIYLLRCGPAPDEELCRALGMDAGRLAAAAGKLTVLPHGAGRAVVEHPHLVVHGHRLAQEPAVKRAM